ncbi:hypothetical protein P152DRAFT_420564 [Eremomyces bilateralis CBS 781.70]|uniref:NIMA interactive protein n=1 Tax=Eremomyces bilateralis CBS 781.70 TaxID=1392243 RepID=A0A6G1FXW7_9PEZI|nr:uncharacterized protein P152DRAFT_420564 [Eremomyces bilateralis CBS 781.70]KAF1810624.1 hypothetical protein P152DRAFT_420564 [Eremomyces bilateralis CBS 781.70]
MTTTDAYNLKTAAQYVNNLLLARGLLRNGKPIEFARPSKGEGGADATMAQIINLVHDLILRRDREQTQRERIASTLQNLRTETSDQTHTISRLETRVDDLSRQLSLANAQERSARAALRTAENAMRSMKEEMVRLKTTVVQVRTACANDVRKRDVQINRLKGHLTTHQRGANRGGLAAGSITITPGAVVPGVPTTGSANMNGRYEDGDVAGAETDDMYSLKQETTEFLTSLSQSLADENDNLISLVRSTVATLRELQGLPESTPLNAETGHGAEEGQEPGGIDGMLQTLPTSYESLAADADIVLENLRDLLTNPNFVPVEEVAVREDQILKLREGWEKMESRWKDAIALMEGWRKRITEGGDTINLEEIKMGLGLGMGLTNAVSAAVSKAEIVGEMDSDEEDEQSEDEELVDDHAHAILEAEIEQLETSKNRSESRTAHLDFDRIETLMPLRDSAGNIKSPRKSVGFASNSSSSNVTRATDENESELELELELLGQVEGRGSKQDVSSSEKPVSKTSESRIPRKTHTRGFSPTRPQKERYPKLTIEEKLSVAQAEAEAAAATQTKTESVGTLSTGETKLQNRRKSVIPTRIGGRPRRRKSTLSPEELESLMVSN